MDMENKIVELRENPEELEKLYHEKPEPFTSSLFKALEKYPDSPVLHTWRARLSYTPMRVEKPKEIIELVVLAALCIATGLAVRLPALWGLDILKVDPTTYPFYSRNLSFFFLPMIAFYYAFLRKPGALLLSVIAGIFVVSLIAINLFPMKSPYQTGILLQLHLPLLLWLTVGLAFTAGAWRKPTARLDFLRVTGEIFIYAVLILLGGGVLTAFTFAIFGLIGIDIQTFYILNIEVVGLFLAPLIAAYIAEKKREIALSFAPILSYIFTPLFLVTIAAFLVTMLVLGKNPYTDRDFLLIFNGMLLLVIALTFFNIAERKAGRVLTIFDILNAALIVGALAVDCIALSAIVVRLSSFGVSPNRIAVLGENLLLLANLLLIGVQYVKFFMKRADFSYVTNMTARFLPAYFAWLLLVVFAFPAIFGFQ